MPNARIAALAAEITSDPLARGYVGMTDAEVVASLALVNRPGPVPAKDVAKLLHMAGKWAAISLAAGAEQAPRALVEALSTFGDFDLQAAQVRAVVDARLGDLVSALYLTADDKAAVLALEDGRQSRLQELGLGVVNVGDVMAARRVE